MSTLGNSFSSNPSDRILKFPTSQRSEGEIPADGLVGRPKDSDDNLETDPNSSRYGGCGADFGRDKVRFRVSLGGLMRSNEYPPVGSIFAKGVYRSGPMGRQGKLDGPLGTCEASIVNS